MANAKKNQKAVATKVAAEIINEQAAEVTTEAEVESTEQVADAATEMATEDVQVEKAKRDRNYSQTAIDKADLERLNAFKANIKETRKINVSNQTILAAALECLSTTENMEAFLKSLVTTAADKQRAKDLAAYAALKKKLEGDEPAEAVAEEATEATPETEA